LNFSGDNEVGVMILGVVHEVLGSQALVAAFFAYFVSCVIKVILCYVKERKLNFRRMWEPGGMPSTHSAAMAGLTTSVGLASGFGSVDFAMALTMAIIVMYDAMGVRRAAGEHASVLNVILDALDESDPSRKKTKLCEVLGHTPLEVLGGGVCGVFTVLLLWNLLTPYFK
jgi:acid phosphatase family membrane protein YuiD